MKTSQPRFFVVTGGPGSGKTTLIEALAKRGMPTVGEAGRAIIRDQVAIGGHALPWADSGAFAEMMLAFDIRAYHDTKERTTGPVVFDRGIPDVIGYRRLVGLPVPPYCEAAARTFRYHQTVFIAPPWREIFAQDAERRQTFEEAEATFDAMTKVYEDYGYDLVVLPRDTIAARTAFVMETARCL